MRTILFGEWSSKDADNARPMESDKVELLLRDLKTLPGAISETANDHRDNL